MLSSAKTVGRYELLDELGRGAMGVVYKARDPKIDRLVAIKTISIFAHTPEEDHGFRERLFTEAKAAGRLSHPGIVTIYDVGEDPETLNPYIVMEYVAGDSLEKQVAQSAERFPLDRTLALTEQLAEALDYAHSQGIVHRDIKPANILLPESGPPKIADFGIAKLNLGHSALRQAVGTPAFMSPEQLNGDPVDGRSDLFSLGVVLYTLLTGYRPFQGNSAMTVSFKVVNRNPLPATTFDSTFPPELDYVISRAMAKDPAQRYPTGREMATDVRGLRETLGRPRRSVAGSFDARYLQPASKVINPISTPKEWSPASGKLGGVGKQRPSWQKWTYATSALLAIPLLGVMWLILPRTRVRSSSTAPKTETAWAKTSTPASDLTRPVEAVPRNSVTGKQSSEARRGKPFVRQASQGNLLMRMPKTVAAPQPAEEGETSGLTGATLRLRIEHHFHQAEVFIWVDDRLAYDQTVDGAVKKKMVVFRG
ncbi:MAG: serine/threonine protein kinase, partial [Acidobacteria bacterium]|nr:serine/threonine protein kinase [Acidobacteriota bacterium]